MKKIAGILLLTLTLVPMWTLAESLPTQTIESVKVPRVYRLDGVIEATNRSTVSAQTSGQVKEVLFDVDDVVKQGDVIVVIDDAQQGAAVASAEANLRSAEAQRLDAQKEYERVKSVYEKKAVSKSALDKAVAARKSAIAGVQAAKAALTQAREQLNYTKVAAPYTGIVTERFVEVGETASPGQKLMSGISLEHLRVDVDVPQSLVTAVRSERDARIWMNGKWIDAVKVTVFPVADRATDTFRVRLELPKDVPNAFPGMYVKVAVSVGSRQVLAVPREAVVYRSEVIGVYTVDDKGRISLRHIRIGNALPDGRLVVLSGLDKGDKVVIDPHAAVVALKQQRQERADHE